MSAVVRWVIPELEPPPAPLPPVVVEEIEPERIAPPSLEELQAIREQAHQAGYEDGVVSGQAHGLAQGQGEVRRLIAQIEGILDNFTRPLARLESEVAAALGELAVRIAGHLVGRACACDASLVAMLVAQALDAVGTSAREVEVHLHPDDVARLTVPARDFPEPLLTLPEGVRLVPDPVLSRGDLRVHTESVRIDGSLNARLEQALERVMRQVDEHSPLPLMGHSPLPFMGEGAPKGVRA